MEAAGAAASIRPDRTLIVLNPRAPRHDPGGVRAAFEREAAAREIPLDVVELPEREPEAFVAGHVARAVRERWDRVVVVGGDGTVSMVASALARHGRHATRLAVVPGGTTNVLAKELGLPDALDAAVEVALASDRALELDAIRSGDRWFWTQVGIGPDAVMIRETTAEDRRRLGRLAYIATFVRRALGHPRRAFRIEVDGVPLRARAWQLILANAGSAGMPPFTWGPRIDPTDGVLDLCVFDVRSGLDHLHLFWRVVTGRHRKDERARFLRVRRRVVVESRHPTLAQGDGEVIGRTPITFELEPRAIQIVVARAPEPMADPAVPAAAAPEPAPETVAADVETMVAQRSRTWVLQGVLRHPITWMQALDAALFLRVNSLALGAPLDRGLVWVSRLMHYGEGWAIVVLAMTAVDLGTGLRAAAEGLPVLWITMLIVNFPLKALFRRRRPFVAFVKARVLGPRPADFSFPSGHTAAAFGGALVLSAHAPGAAPAFYALAAVVGFSRVYLGVHYPSDVLIGGAVGMTLAFLCRALLRLAIPGLG